jgi:hypothetical protein
MSSVILAARESKQAYKGQVQGLTFANDIVNSYWQSGLVLRYSAHAMEAER